MYWLNACKNLIISFVLESDFVLLRNLFLCWLLIFSSWVNFFGLFFKVDQLDQWAWTVSYIILHFIHIVPQFLMSGYLDRISPLYSAMSNVCMHLFQHTPARTVLLKKLRVYCSILFGCTWKRPSGCFSVPTLPRMVISKCMSLLISLSDFLLSFLLQSTRLVVVVVVLYGPLLAK